MWGVVSGCAGYAVRLCVWGGSDGLEVALQNTQFNMHMRDLAILGACDASAINTGTKFWPGGFTLHMAMQAPWRRQMSTDVPSAETKFTLRAAYAGGVCSATFCLRWWREGVNLQLVCTITARRCQSQGSLKKGAKKRS